MAIKPYTKDFEIKTKTDEATWRDFAQLAAEANQSVSAHLRELIQDYVYGRRRRLHVPNLRNDHDD